MIVPRPGFRPPGPKCETFPSKEYKPDPLCKELRVISKSENKNICLMRLLGAERKVPKEDTKKQVYTVKCTDKLEGAQGIS